jgi:hypothetical protein
MGSQLRDALKASGVVATTKAEQSKPIDSQLKKPSDRGRASKTDLTRPPLLKGSFQTEPRMVFGSLQPLKASLERVSDQCKSIPRKESFLSPSGTKPFLKVTTVVPKPLSRLVRTGVFHPHPLFVDDAQDDCVLPELGSLGTERQLTETPEDETDLVIGLDFGTSATKVVIRDLFSAMGVFPVPLNGNLPGIEGYLLPSRVFRTGDVYSLTGGECRIGNMKLRLLECGAKSPVDEFNDCCAFLALVIRRAKAWLFSEYHDIYARHGLNWRVNLGLAARSYEERDTVELFRRLAWAAANVAADQGAEQLTVEVVDRYRRLSLKVFSKDCGDAGDGVAFAMSDVDAVPEVSAQLHGFMATARWDWAARPVMMLVDVGAGTVDSALFHVRVSEGKEGVLTFYSSRVERHGVMNLHRDRVEWLRALLPDGDQHEDARRYLAEIEKPTDRLRPIPSGASEYLPGYDIEVVDEDGDSIFRRKKYRLQVAGSISDAKISKGVRVTQIQGIPLLLCGGGSRMEFYSQIAEMINDTPGWDVSVELTKLPVPQDLVDIGWHAEDFDRISVAYGLSMSGDGGSSLGQIVRAIDVPNRRAYETVEDETRFISKDQV